MMKWSWKVPKSNKIETISKQEFLKHVCDKFIYLKLLNLFSEIVLTSRMEIDNSSFSLLSLSFKLYI